MQTTFGLALRGEGTDTLELDVYDVIGESWFSEGVTAKSVRAKLREAREAKLIRARIHSSGGDVLEGLAIYNLLLDHPARVEVDIDGLAASMASVIAMAGDEIRIAESAFMMIHNPWGLAMGESDDLRQHADLLDKMREQLVGIYKKRTKRNVDDIGTMMDAETWMTGAEAVENGFADKATQNKKRSKGALQAFAAVRNREFLNVPSELAQISPPAPAAQQDKSPAQPSPEQPEKPEEVIMTISKAITQALSLAEDADEAAAVAAIARFKASAHVGTEIEKLVGCSGGEAIGAVRALKEIKANHEELRGEVDKLKAAGSRRDFESALAEGRKDKKLTPIEAQHYTDRFEAALVAGDDGSAVVADLRGWLKVATRRVGPDLRPADGSGGPVQHNGKPFEAMSGPERHRLKKDAPDLYDALRNDALERHAI